MFPLPLWRGGRLAALLCLAAIGLGSPARAQDVELYDQPDFRGMRLTLGAATPDLADYGIGGRVASVVVRRGSWEFCTQPRFGGACVTVGPGRYAQLPPALRGNLHSLRDGGSGPPGPAAAPRPTPPVERSAAALILFAGEFDGPQVALREPVADLRERDFNDSAQSVEVRSGHWELCNDAGHAGACLRLGPGRHLLPPGFRGETSSLRPAPGTASPQAATAPVPAGNPALVLFEHSHFGGRQLALQGPESRLDQAGFNDTASALQIFRGRWQLCEHIDFSGECLVLGPGRHVLSGAMHDAVSSLRPVFGSDNRPLPPGGGLTLWENGDYSGRSQLLTAAAANLAALRFNDRSSSVEVHAGQWELCDDAQFSGRCMVFGPGRHVLPVFLNDRLSSLRPR